MGTLTYDFLKESLFLDPAMIADDYASVGDDELLKKLEEYREYVIEHEAELQEELPSNPSMLTVFSGRDLPAIESLRQRALYINTQIIEDPLFEQSCQPTEVAANARQAAGFPATRLDRRSLASAARFMNTVTPLVASNYVKFLPTSRWSEPPRSQPSTSPKMDMSQPYRRNYSSGLGPGQTPIQ